jgi:hypothetical protein
MQLLDGQISLNLDATSAIFGVAPHVSLDGDLAEYACSILGAITVLTVGSIWRKRKLRELEHLALPDAVEGAAPADRR